MADITRQKDAFPASYKDRVTGVILAGGQGKRMGMADKGLQVFDGKPMVKHVIDRIAPQVNKLIINANRNGETYRSFGYPVFKDVPLDYSGPLAGFLTGLRHCESPWLLTVPCDTPFVSPELVEKLAIALEKEQADLAIACIPSGDGCRIQPVFSLMKKTLRPHLESFLENGGRKIDSWTSTLKTVEVCFNDTHAFENINTPVGSGKIPASFPPTGKTLMTQHASVLDELTRGLPSYNPDSLSVRLAHDLIHSFVSPVGAIERVVLKNSLGRVLAEDIVSSFSVPAFDNSAMDGYAFSCKNLDLSQPVTLKVAGYSYAGHPYTTRVGFGECIRIMSRRDDSARLRYRSPAGKRQTAR